MTVSAKSLKVSYFERVLPRFALQWLDMVALKPPGPPAFDAAPVVALEDSTADASPVAGIQVGVVATQIIFYENEISIVLRFNGFN